MNLTWADYYQREVSFDLGPGNGEVTYLVQELDGLGSPPTTPQTVKAPFQDGETLLTTVAEPRTIFLRVVVFGDSMTDLQDNKDLLIDRLNPKNGLGELTYEPVDGRVFHLKAVPDGAPIFLNMEGIGFQVALVSFLAVDPYWYETDEHSEEIDEDPGETNIHNDGQIETPVRIVVTGPATWPKITNKSLPENENFIYWQGEVGSGEELVITTGFNEKMITLDGSPAMGELTLDSEFWALALFDNLITWEATGTDGNTQVEVFWRRRYAGA